jgi:hypothetical protein
MLDIIANNNWERPIYFSGGAFADEDYVWMKDYLQLDGMCYKLVPIKTAVDRANPFDMGRVDPELMYDLVKSWNWGGSGENIYYDVETRKNGITYRGNIARLIETLLSDGEDKKAEEMADLAMEKMPVDDYGYYTLLEPYISAYFEVGNTEKARKLYLDVAKKYQENLVWYSKQELSVQNDIIDEIFTDIQKYRSLVDGLVAYDERDFALEQTKVFKEYLGLFAPLMGEDILEEEPELDINDILQDGSPDSVDIPLTTIEDDTTEN